MKKIFKGKKFFLLPFGKMKHITPFFPAPRGMPRAKDRLTMSGIIHVQINGMPWHQALGE